MSRAHGGLILAAFDVPMHSRRQTAFSTEEDYLMPHKTKQAALKAAYKALGAEAIEGVDFVIKNTGAGYEHAEVPAANAQAATEKAKRGMDERGPIPAKAAPKQRAKVAAKKKPAPTASAPKAKAPTEGPTKTDLLISLMRRDGGATSAEMQEAAGGWAPHSVRGLLGTLRAKGHVIESKKLKGEPTIYRMPKVAAPAAAPTEDVV